MGMPSTKLKSGNCRAPAGYRRVQALNGQIGRMVFEMQQGLRLIVGHLRIFDWMGDL
jgi:hypothetical protein